MQYILMWQREFQSEWQYSAKKIKFTDLMCVGPGKHYIGLSALKANNLIEINFF